MDTQKWRVIWLCLRRLCELRNVDGMAHDWMEETMGRNQSVMQLTTNGFQRAEGLEINAVKKKTNMQFVHVFALHFI